MPGFPFSPSLFYGYNLPLLCLSPQGSILQGCCLSLATFSLRKCCIRLVANRAVTKLEYQRWRRWQQKQKHPKQASLWGYIVTLQCFYLLLFWHFHLFTHTQRRGGGKKRIKEKDEVCAVLGFNLDDSISTTGTEAKWEEICRKPSKQEDGQGGSWN